MEKGSSGGEGSSSGAPPNSASVASSSQPRYDVQTAIAACRASHPEQARFLARKHGEHTAYLKIQVRRRLATRD